MLTIRDLKRNKLPTIIKQWAEFCKMLWKGGSSAFLSPLTNTRGTGDNGIVQFIDPTAFKRATHLQINVSFHPLCKY